MNARTVIAFALLFALFVAADLSASSHRNGPPEPTVSAASLSDPTPPTCGIVPSPSIGTLHNYLYGIDALSSGDAWAVGYYDLPNNASQTLIEHWNGAQWTVYPSPNPGGYQNKLYGVAALAADDVWAVGDYALDTMSYAHALVLHWDGNSWIQVASPTTGANNILLGVSATSANDVWAVGYSGSNSFTLTMHWDGNQWTIVPSPSPGAFGNWLLGVVALSANNVWAVGVLYVETFREQPLIEHFDGSQWTRTTIPDNGLYSTGLWTVAALTSDDVWAVGSTEQGYGSYTIHFDGNAWNVVP